MFKTNFKNNSQALAYSVYMMVGSFFKSCKCRNEMVESNFFLSYCEAGTKLQYTLEERAEKYALKNIFEKDVEFMELCDNSDVITSFVPSGTGFIVRFVGNDFALNILACYEHGKCYFNSVKKFKLNMWISKSRFV